MPKTREELDAKPSTHYRPVPYTFYFMRLVWEARQLGYAVALHGSMVNDLDVVAIPWTDEAVDAETLVETLCQKIGITKNTLCPNDPEKKPHGRLAYLLDADAGFVIDLSVMPLNASGL